MPGLKIHARANVQEWLATEFMIFAGVLLNHWFAWPSHRTRKCPITSWDRPKLGRPFLRTKRIETYHHKLRYIPIWMSLPLRQVLLNVCIWQAEMAWALYFVDIFFLSYFEPHFSCQLSRILNGMIVGIYSLLSSHCILNSTSTWMTWYIAKQYIRTNAALITNNPDGQHLNQTL